MKVVVDANLILATVLELPYSDKASEKLRDWKQSDTDLLAPYLLVYEISSALRKAISLHLLTTETALEAVKRIHKLRIRYAKVTFKLHQRAFYWAEKIHQLKTYDAQYLALAESEAVDFWTADKRLANTAHQCGAHWVHLLGDE